MAESRAKFQSDSLLIEMEVDNDVVKVNVDNVIERLLNVTELTPLHLAEMELVALCRACREAFMLEPMLLELKIPINVVGDIHGHLHELIRWFDCSGYPDVSKYLFLGGYVNRGKFSLETILLLICYKIKHPQTFNLLRGNHETSAMVRAYGFYDECKKRYNSRASRTFIELFNHMPIAALIQDRIFCCHGGPGPDLHNFDQIRKLHRPLEVTDEGIACDLLWADPEKQGSGWGMSERGISVTFGADVLFKFMAKHELELFCRGHQVVEEGFEFFAKRQMLTLFSAPNYCGEYDNAGAILVINDALICTLKVIKLRLQAKPKDTITVVDSLTK